MSAAPKVRVAETRVVIRNAFTRMPFRFGVVTMRAAPVALLEATVLVDGRATRGYASDFLAYKWFDKRPERTPADNVADLLRALGQARRVCQDAAADTAFGLWHGTAPEIERLALADDFNRLGASFAASMLERAVIDAVGRATGCSFDRLVREGALGIDATAVFPELAADEHLHALPDRPLDRVALRHTIGLVDPITPDEVGPDAPADGFPVTLADYLETDRLRYLKVKVSGALDADLDRLGRIAAVIALSPRPVAISLDGNEQYKRLEDFVALMERIRATPALAAFYDSILFIEQPLDRAVALAGPLPPAALTAVGRPLLIDEADGWTSAFAEALDLGYRGVSHKNCKGVYRSLLNAALARRRSTTLGEPCFLSAEDLTNLAVVPLQADLAVVATLGIGHVERNGHHYFRGLAHLPAAERTAALARHPDLYEPHGGEGGLRIEDGYLAIGSLQVPGLGVADPPDLDQGIAEADWHFGLLEQGDHGQPA